MSEPVTCQTCGAVNPPPVEDCENGLDHYVGTERGCGSCGRTLAACAKRPCSAWPRTESSDEGSGGADGA